MTSHEVSLESGRPAPSPDDTTPFAGKVDSIGRQGAPRSLTDGPSTALTALRSFCDPMKSPMSWV
jgi:hypothetical protein